MQDRTVPYCTVRPFVVLVYRARRRVIIAAGELRASSGRVPLSGFAEPDLDFDQDEAETSPKSGSKIIH